MLIVIALILTALTIGIVPVLRLIFLAVGFLTVLVVGLFLLATNVDAIIAFIKLI